MRSLSLFVAVTTCMCLLASGLRVSEARDTKRNAMKSLDPNRKKFQIFLENRAVGTLYMDDLVRHLSSGESRIDIQSVGGTAAIEAALGVLQSVPSPRSPRVEGALDLLRLVVKETVKDSAEHTSGMRETGGRGESEGDKKKASPKAQGRGLFSSFLIDSEKRAEKASDPSSLRRLSYEEKKQLDDEGEALYWAAMRGDASQVTSSLNGDSWTNRDPRKINWESPRDNRVRGGGVTWVDLGWGEFVLSFEESSGGLLEGDM
uniref:Uncharacterized protein n=1 Tax=Chromera velia CCMP2878 TaxID=1169474 RepID=A0A0G4FSK0_9ALVE|eukprot:Cvel_18558.t1-p1 / transcript=Cvel_18558.t1 / gene=Cvel_18558 / organism=Chromera_velia_CCMP2878 / gene_product=hypothetical protein / transcript_product=hypothetical protein / location=Cvel_scaffold1546:7246-9184(-) / protein_length=260 / sequence_SO=supercontig / SO=protein_coding / is_pseudo=false